MLYNYKLLKIKILYLISYNYNYYMYTRYLFNRTTLIKIVNILFADEDCACRTIRVMINGQEAELTIIDIPYIEMSVSFFRLVYVTKQ